MRRIDARRKKASALRLRSSQVLASLRQRLSHAIVRSTIHRLGTIFKTGRGVVSLIPAVDKQPLQEWKHRKQRCHDQNATVAILDIGRMDDGVKQEA